MGCGGTCVVGCGGRSNVNINPDLHRPRRLAHQIATTTTSAAATPTTTTAATTTATATSTTTTVRSHLGSMTLGSNVGSMSDVDWDDILPRGDGDSESHGDIVPLADAGGAFEPVVPVRSKWTIQIPTPKRRTVAEGCLAAARMRDHKRLKATASKKAESKIEWDGAIEMLRASGALRDIGGLPRRQSNPLSRHSPTSPPHKIIVSMTPVVPSTST